VSPEPEISVVIVAHRARELVLRCLESLREHGGVPHEAIVVDDGSGDGTPEAVQASFPDARVVAKPVNEGLAAGRNSALPLVKAPRVLMLDSDTQVTPGALEAMAEVLDRDPKVGLIGPKLVNPDGSVQPSCRRWPSLWAPIVRRWPLVKINPEPALHRRHMMLDFDHASERPVVTVMGAAQMWRANLPELIGRYDEKVSSYGGEDQDWCLRVWEAGLEVRYAPQAVVVHDWQRVVRHHRPWNTHTARAARDFYYLQWKHRALRRDPRLRSLD
jgi:N-acetylglucosaminyl-diphospho-decaprenol L-rhamnosyltransferase